MEFLFLFVAYTILSTYFTLYIFKGPCAHLFTRYLRFDMGSNNTPEKKKNSYLRQGKVFIDAVLAATYTGDARKGTADSHLQ